MRSLRDFVKAIRHQGRGDYMAINATTNYDISHILVSSIMIQAKSERQKNKNNKTKPANLLKKEYLESYEELKKSIKENQKT